MWLIQDEVNGAMDEGRVREMVEVEKGLRRWQRQRKGEGDGRRRGMKRERHRGDNEEPLG